MRVGDRVSLKNNHKVIGTLIEMGANKFDVVWDDGVKRRVWGRQIFVVGHDPKVSGDEGVWRAKEKHPVHSFLDFCRSM